MKTTLLLATVFLFASSLVQAQLDKGKIQVGGTISANHQKYNRDDFNPGYTANNVILTPSIGRFYKTNHLAGLFLDFAYAQNARFSPTINRTFGGGIFFRQYQPVVQKLYVFFDERLGYDYSNSNGYGTGTLRHGYAINASLQTGLAYNLTKRAQLELSLNNLVNAGYSNSNLSEGYGLGSSLERPSFSNIAFGFRYYLK